MSILTRLAEINEIPTLPEIMLKIQAMVNSDEGDAKELAGLVRHDPALSAKILKVANSAFYSTAATRISSIELAVTRIGFNEVRNISMAVSLIKQFSRRSQLLDYRAFWKHSLTAAFTAAAISRHLPGRLADVPANDILFLSGLMHDIGILVYDQFFHDEFKQIISAKVKNEISYLDAESAAVPHEGHATVGAALLELWKLDPSVVAAVRGHHAPSGAPESFIRLARMTALVERALCGPLGAFEGLSSSADDGHLAGLGLTRDDEAALAAAAEKEGEKTEFVFSVDSPAGGGLRRI